MYSNILNSIKINTEYKSSMRIKILPIIKLNFVDKKTTSSSNHVLSVLILFYLINLHFYQLETDSKKHVKNYNNKIQINEQHLSSKHMLK